MAVQLQESLTKLLRKHGVDTKVDDYLLSKRVVSVVNFGGLADSKALGLKYSLDLYMWCLCCGT